MQLTKPTADTTLELSLFELRNTATSFESLCQWFQENLESLNLPIGRFDNELMSVTINGSFANVFDHDDIENPVWKNKIEITQNASATPPTSVTSFFNTAQTLDSQLVTTFDITLAFSDWPFIAAALAYDILTEELVGSSAERHRAEKVLTRFVPQHFPGFTWETLQSLHSAELLPAFANGYIKYTGFVEMLFNSRDKIAAASLPDSLSP